LRERLNDFAPAQLLAVDPHEEWSARYLLKETGAGLDALQYPLLLDPALVVSATYGVASQMRIHVEWSNRPATFVVDRDGVLRYAHRARAFADRPTAAEVAAVLRRLG
jgi:peroxiredoxin